jgi:hypothetical protein
LLQRLNIPPEKFDTAHTFHRPYALYSEHRKKLYMQCPLQKISYISKSTACVFTKWESLMTGEILHLHTTLLLYDTIHSYTDNTFLYALGHHQVWLQEEKKRLNIYIQSVRRRRSQTFTINCNITIVYSILHMLILPTNAQDWHLHLHIHAYLNEPLGLQATSGSWKNKPNFWKWSLFSSVLWQQDQTWFSKQWFNHRMQTIAHGGFIAFSHHESFRLPHTYNTHICLHV